AGGDGTALSVTGAGIVLNAGASAGAATLTNTGTGTIDVTATGTGDITLANNAISIGDGLLELFADGDAILVTTDAGGEIDADGDIELVASEIGATNGGLDIAGDGGGDRALFLTVTAVAGDVVIDLATDQFSELFITVDDADADVDIDLSGGDAVEVRGETTTGNAATSTVWSVTTTALAPTLVYELTEDGADLLLHTGTVTAGGDVVFISEDDIVVGDAAGTAVVAGPGVNVTLIADSDGDGSGAILDGGGTITMNGGDLQLVAGSGIGTVGVGNAIEIAGLTDLAAETATGGIFIHNSTSGDVNVTSVTTDGQTTTGLSSGAGSIELTNVAGAITLSQAVVAAGQTVTLSASGGIFDNHVAAADVSATALELVSDNGVATALDPLDTAVSLLAVSLSAGDAFVSNTNAASVTVTGTNTGAGILNIGETAGDLAVGTGDIVTSGGPVLLSATAADRAILLPVGAEIITTGGGASGADITLTADTMTLAGAIRSGTGLVTLQTADAGQAIRVGNGAADDATGLGLTTAELDTVFSAGGLTVGSSTNSAGLTVVGPLDLTLAGNLTGGTFTLASGTGDIVIQDDVISPIDLAITTAGGNIIFAGGSLTATGNTITLSAGGGGAILGASAAGTDVTAAALAATSTGGIGSADALETSVLALAAANSGSGDIRILNDRGGLPLRIDSAAALSGVTNSAPASLGGDIEITNVGRLRVEADVLSTAGGDIVLTAATGGVPLLPINVVIDARVHATGGSGDVVLNSALGRTTINEAVAGPEVLVTGAGVVDGTFGVNFSGGATIGTATGNVGGPFAILSNVAATPVTITGFTSVSGGFGTAGDTSLVVSADFNGVFLQSDSFGSAPGTFLFEQLFVTSPNPNPADPITITVVLVRNARVLIVENTVTVVVEAPVPGEGFGAAFFAIETGAVPLFVEQAESADALPEASVAAPTAQQSAGFEATAAEQETTGEELELVLRVLRRDGSRKEDILFRGDEAESLLANLQQFLAGLPDGRYRILLKEPGRNRLRLIRDVTLESGVPKSDYGNIAETPPTTSLPPLTKGGARGGAEPVATEVESSDPRATEPISAPIPTDTAEPEPISPDDGAASLWGPGGPRIGNGSAIATAGALAGLLPFIGRSPLDRGSAVDAAMASCGAHHLTRGRRLLRRVAKHQI
ncbi:MAG: hypothetical protein KY476_17690, partial [Planctomycetes bacterium]|nr:hypothetical protein [Planctomycetota bacterium]